jgi:short-subunit dehydrogenase
VTTTSLVTGASSGLGAEYARQLAAKGDALVLVARDRDRLESLAAALRERHGSDVEVLPADLLDPAQLDRVVERLADRARPVGTLVNNAGFGLPLDFAANDIEDEVRHLRLHTEVPMRLTHAVLGSMVDHGGGRVINVASVAAFIPRSTYGACKGWLISFSRWANVHYRRAGIVVTAVCPGYTHTDFHRRLGLPVGQEGVPSWMWLDAPMVVAASLRDVERGKAVSVPSLRYKGIIALGRVAPPALAARLGQRGR